MKLRNLTISVLALASYAMPLQAANSEAYTKTEKGYREITIKADSDVYKNIEYTVYNDKKLCQLKLEHRHTSDWIRLTDRNCNGTIDKIEIKDVELSRDAAHELMFKKADNRYKETVEQYKLQKQVNDYFQNLDTRIGNLLSR